MHVWKTSLKQPHNGPALKQIKELAPKSTSLGIFRTRSFKTAIMCFLSFVTFKSLSLDAVDILRLKALG